jgi:uncharacterized protein (TIGR03437 family)
MKHDHDGRRVSGMRSGAACLFLLAWLALPTRVVADDSGFLTAATLLGPVDLAWGGLAAMTTDSQGNVYVAGNLTDMSKRPPAQSELLLSGQGQAGEESGYVMKIAPALSTVIYAVYLGASGSAIRAIAVDREGSAYITGNTLGAGFPLKNPIQVPTSLFNAFVMKINPSGTAVVYSSVIGGSSNWGSDQGKAIAVDGEGNAYVTGATSSQDFPVVNAIQTKIGSPPAGCGFIGCEHYYTDAFLFKINAAGTALVYSTYLGGNGDDAAYAVALDGSGNVFVAGTTTSSNYPVATGINAVCTTIPTPYTPCMGLPFVVKIDAAGSRIVAAARLGAWDVWGQIWSLAVDSSGNVFAAGSANWNYPATALTTEVPKPDGTFGAFVTKLDAALGTIVYSVWPGGGSANMIAVDKTGAAYVAGSYPVQEDFETWTAQDVTVVRISPAGDAAVMRLLGGSDADMGMSLALSPSGAIYVAGQTYSFDFPATLGAVIQSWTAAPENFLALLDPASFLSAGPAFTAAGLVNAASYTAGAVSPGEIVAIFGDNLGPPSIAGAELDSSGRLATDLASTRVFFDGVQAPMIYALRNQVSAIVPYGVAAANTSVEVEYQGARSAAVSVPVVSYTPALFGGFGATRPRPVAAINRDNSINDALHPAHLGDVVTVFATGLGPTSVPSADGEICGTDLKGYTGTPSLTIGGTPAQFQYVGCSPGTVVAVDQINAVIPLAAGTGPAVPIALSTSAGEPPAEILSIAIAP